MATKTHTQSIALVLVVVVLLGVGGAMFAVRNSSRQAVADLPTLQAGTKALVFIIPGTYGSSSKWPLVIDGQVTFASELQRAMVAGGIDCSIYPEIWPSSIFNDNRETAAKRIATVIDEQSQGYDRVFIVAHSHGGNIGLMAAGLCRTKIETVVCLSTPHVHLKTKTADGQTMYLPVYCSAETVQNVRHIVTLRPDNDWVPDVWSNALLTGLNEKDAVRLTKTWRESNKHPRLARDSFFHRLFESGNIVASPNLSVGGQHVELCCLIQDTFKIKPHNSIHTRNMGYHIGQLLAADTSPAAVERFRATLLPREADDGEPLPAADPIVTRDQKSVGKLAGWQLVEAKLTIAPSLLATPLDLDNSLPDLQLKLYAGNGKELWGKTDVVQNVSAAEWKTKIFAYQGTVGILKVIDVDPPGAALLGDKIGEIGSVEIDFRQPPPDRIEQTGWTVQLTWHPLHY